MSFGETVKNSLGILGFKTKPLMKVANDEKATAHGFLILALAGVAIAISQLQFINIIFGPIMMIIGFIIGYSIYHFFAKFVFGGKATGAQYFRSLSCACIIYWFTFIPFIGRYLQYLAALLIIALNIFILNKVHKLSMTRAVILGLLFVILLPLLLFLIGGIAYFGVLSPSNLYMR